jgi:hypothetical protein
MVSSGLQIAAIVGLFVYAGYRLDAKYGSSPSWTLGCSVAGIAVALYLFLAPFLKKK